MTDPDQRTPASEMLRIDPAEGFGPHVSEEFLGAYGEESVFVTAAVDCLTHRFVHRLVHAKRLPAEYRAPQYGTPAMRERLEVLIAALDARGAAAAAVVLMRSVVGQDAAHAFLGMASELLGCDVIARWLERLKSKDYSGADATLASH